MAIVTFWGGMEEHVGVTSSCIAFATHISIQHNIKVLLVSTSLYDTIIKESFWQEKKKKSFSLFGGNIRNRGVETSGIVGLDRMLRSNKISPDLITDYAKIILTNRLEILLGVEGELAQYEQIKEDYAQIINLAGKYYDMVIVDLDKRIGTKAEKDILDTSNIIVPVVSQRAKQIEQMQKMIKEGNILKENNSVLTIGNYMENTKYNAKNITRSLLKQKDLINTVPYNNLFFEATQEGTVIDLFLNFMRIKEKDENYNFIKSLNELNDTIKGKIEILQMMG